MSFLTGADTLIRSKVDKLLRIADLRVNLGSWQWCEQSPCPPWAMLEKAAMWTKETVRKTLGQQRTLLTTVLEGAGKLRVVSVDRADVEREATLTLYKVEGRGVPDALKTMPVRCGVWEVRAGDEGRPDVLTFHMNKSVPLLVWGQASIVRAAVQEAAKEFLNYTTAELQLFIRTGGPRTTGRLKFDQLLMTMMSPEGSVVSKVYPPTTLCEA